MDRYDRFTRMTDVPLMVLSLLWLPVLVVPMVATLSPDLAETFDAIDYFVWAVFVVEYLAKLYLVPTRLKFIRTHVVDLAVIAMPMLRPLRAARLLRFLRVARAGLLVTNALNRGRAVLTHRGLHYVLLTALAVVFVGAAIVLVFERKASGGNIHSYGDALWWALVTMTTIGYGDHFPVSTGGRGVAVVLMLVGISLVGVVTATIASYFIEDKSERDKTALIERLDRLEAMVTQILNQHGRGQG